MDRRYNSLGTISEYTLDATVRGYFYRARWRPFIHQSHRLRRDT
jgi:hypothetical protein